MTTIITCIRRAVVALMLVSSGILTARAGAQTTYYVDGACGDDAWTGTSAACTKPDGPKRTIHAGIDAAVSGDTVIVTDGAYTGDGNLGLDFGGRSMMLRSAGGDPNTCIIDCEHQGNGFLFHSGETLAALVEGITVRNANSSALCCVSSSVTIRHCVFDWNTGARGGALAVDDGLVIVENCTFAGNDAGIGGAIYCRGPGAVATILNCGFCGNHASSGGALYAEEGALVGLVDSTFTENSSSCLGGAIKVAGATCTVIGCEFTANSATNAFACVPRGGAIHLSESAVVVTDCTFALNQAVSKGPSGTGGAICNNCGDLTVTNCTFSGNSTSVGGAIWSAGSSCSTTAANCTAWGDTPDELSGEHYTVTYSNVQGGYAGTGNISADPLFVANPDPGPDGQWGTPDDKGDLHLMPGSPCIDAGSNDSVPADTLDLDGDGDTAEPTPFDLDGAPRFVDDPATADTGNPGAPGPPIVDMGAYEFQVAPPPCAGDANGDGVVDPLDSGYVLARLGCPVGTGDPECDAADANDDGVVDPLDVGFVLARFGACDNEAPPATSGCCFGTACVERTQAVCEGCGGAFGELHCDELVCASTESCCVIHQTPGCDDVEIVACVCDYDPFCCEALWDEACVDEVERFGCGKCP